MSDQKRLKLHTKLVDILGTKNVYYQPPENLKMDYPCIKYSIDNIESKYGNNKKYSMYNLYSIIVIDKKPDNEAIKKILELPYSYFDRHYVSNNLNHDVILLYF